MSVNEPEEDGHNAYKKNIVHVNSCLRSTGTQFVQDVAEWLILW